MLPLPVPSGKAVYYSTLKERMMVETISIRPPRIIGHRGAAGYAPENTLAAIRKAKVLGAQWVEFDTKITQDGVAIVFHDDALERITGVIGETAKTTLQDMQAFDVGTCFDAAFAGERVPTLKDAIGVLAELGLGANIEIKPSPGLDRETAAAVIVVVKTSWPKTLPKPLISSFEAKTLEAVRELAPELERALIAFKIPKNWREILQRLDCVALHAQSKHLTEVKVRAIVDGGYTVRAFTVNEKIEAERLFRWGVDGVFSDFPDRLVELAGA